MGSRSLTPNHNGLRINSIRKYLRPYEIHSRKSTITGAFSAAIAPFDPFESDRVREAITFLGQSPDADLACVYCDAPAQTWDHLLPTVKDRHFSGAGHRLGNLVPSCSSCNVSKRNLTYQSYVSSLPIASSLQLAKIERLHAFQTRYFQPSSDLRDHPRYPDYRALLDQVIELMQKADELAAEIRATPR